MITFRFIVWSLFFGFSLLSAHFKLRLFPHILILFLAAIPFFSLLFVLFLKRKIQIDVASKTPTIERNEMGQWTLSITNTSFIQSAFCQLTQPLGPTIEIYLNPKEEVHLDLNKLSQHVGFLEMDNFTLVLFDAFRLFKFKFKNIQTNPILVLPLYDNPLFNEKMSEALISESEAALASSLLKTDELDTLRLMNQDDSMKKIHWKVSSRLNDWYVRVDRTSLEPRLIIMVDTQFDDDLDVLDKYLEVITTQFYVFLAQPFNLFFKESTYHKVDQMPQVRIELAKLTRFNDLDFQTGQNNDVTILFVKTLSQDLLNQVLNAPNKFIIVCYDLSQDPLLVKLATQNNITLLLRESYEN